MTGYCGYDVMVCRLSIVTKQEITLLNAEIFKNHPQAMDRPGHILREISDLDVLDL